MLSDIFNEQTIKVNLESKTKEAAFIELIEAITEIHPELDKNQMLSSIQDRENKMNTAVASGVAVPHGYYSGFNDIAGAVGISKAGIDYGALDSKPVNFIFLIVMGDSCREKHLHVLNRILTLINSGALNYIRSAKNAQDVYHVLAQIH